MKEGVKEGMAEGMAEGMKEGCTHPRHREHEREEKCLELKAAELVHECGERRASRERW